MNDAYVKEAKPALKNLLDADNKLIRRLVAEEYSIITAKNLEVNKHCTTSAPGAFLLGSLTGWLLFYVCSGH